MWRRFLLFWNIISFLTVGVGCTGASVWLSTDAPTLTSSFMLDKEQVYENIDDKFVWNYPSDWAFYEDSGWVIFEPSETDFKQSPGTVLSKTMFQFYSTVPYGSNSEAWPIPEKSTEVAESILNTFGEYEILEPIKAVSINGRDGAMFLVGRPEGRHQYNIILRIKYNTSISLFASGPADRSEEMQAILNAVALNIQPIDEN